MQVNTNAGYIFDQLESLLSGLTDQQYTQLIDILSGATVGKHYRHIIEFFQCVAVAEQTETICYDNRIRDVRIETDLRFAKSLLKELKEDLAILDNEKKLTLIGDIGTGDNSVNSYIGTTLFREFHYAVEHAIHHMAILKMGITQAFPEVQISADFGVAPSTLRYQSSALASAK
jgi:hypothetical protein